MVFYNRFEHKQDINGVVSYPLCELQIIKDLILYLTEASIEEQDGFWTSMIRPQYSKGNVTLGKIFNINRLKGAMKGFIVRKKISKMIIKESLIDKGNAIAEQHRIEKQTLLDRIKELEEDNKTLRQTNVISNRKYGLSIKMEIEELQHHRQIHHLRKKINNY